MRCPTRLALVPAAALAIALAAPAVAILPGEILVMPAFATPDDTLVVQLLPTAENPCVTWKFDGRVGTTLTISGTRSELGCPRPDQSLNLGALAPGRYRLIAQVPGDASPLFAQVFFDVASNPDASVDPSELVIAPAQPTTLDAPNIVASLLALTCRFPPVFAAPPVVDGDRIVIAATQDTFPIPVPCSFLGTWGAGFRLPPLTAGLKTLELRLNDQLYLERRFTVVAPPDHLALGGRFAASLTWTDRAGAEHLATSVALSDRSGYFWFFARDNVEVTVKLLDGTAVNGSLWFFAASMTDVPFRIDVSWCLGPPGSGAPCMLRSYLSPGGNRNFIDTRAFAGPPS